MDSNIAVLLRNCLHVIFLASIAVSSSSECNFNVKVKQMLLNEGFHRNMTYGLTFQSDNEYDKWMISNCIVGLEQELPAGVYSNPDELGDLRRAHRLNAVPKNRVNVELPTEQSSPMSVFLIGKVVQSNAYLWLPVHARYHQAVRSGGTSRNWIPPPTLYLRCPSDMLEGCGDMSPVTFLCNGGSREKCQWKNVAYTLMTDTPHWDVPVGNTDHYYIVAAGTALVIVVGSLYILKAVHDFRTGYNKKKR